MSLRISLLRHGETTHSGFRGHLDDPLTERGWQQMQQAVQGQQGWTAILSSPLQRCRRFAEQLATERQLSLQLEPDLRELHFGAWEGCTAAELMERNSEALSRFWADPYAFTPPQAEPMTAFAQRLQQLKQRILERYTEGSLLLITHGGVMRYWLAEARGLPPSQLLQVEVPHAALCPVHWSCGDELK